MSSMKFPLDLTFKSATPPERVGSESPVCSEPADQSPHSYSPSLSMCSPSSTTNHHHHQQPEELQQVVDVKLELHEDDVDDEEDRDHDHHEDDEDDEEMPDVDSAGEEELSAVSPSKRSPQLQHSSQQQQSLNLRTPPNSHNRPVGLIGSASATSTTGSKKIRKRTMLPCEHCGKEFDRPSLLTRHLRTHTGEKPHICDICSKGFSTSSSLNTHRRIHTGDKPHRCPTCNKCFTASSNLYYHRMTHNKEKPHKCHLCSKSFPTPGDLKSHMYVHDGSWPFKCHICDRGFSKPTNLKNHMYIHTGDKPHKCEICDKHFALACNLRAHVRTHHEGAESASTTNSQVDANDQMPQQNMSSIDNEIQSQHNSLDHLQQLGKVDLNSSPMAPNAASSLISSLGPAFEAAAAAQTTAANAANHQNLLNNLAANLHHQQLAAAAAAQQQQQQQPDPTITATFDLLLRTLLYPRLLH